jgi:hypothetical protein
MPAHERGRAVGAAHVSSRPARARHALTARPCPAPVPAPAPCTPPAARNAIDRLVRQRDGALKLIKQDKPVVLVLGTGWGAHSFVKVRSGHRREGGARGRAWGQAWKLTPPRTPCVHAPVPGDGLRPV